MAINLIYTGQHGQRIYHFGEQRGASVIHDVRHSDPDHHFEVAAIKLSNPTKGPEAGFSLDYNTFWPQGGQTEEQVQQLLTQLDGGGKASGNNDS